MTENLKQDLTKYFSQELPEGLYFNIQNNGYISFSHTPFEKMMIEVHFQKPQQENKHYEKPKKSHTQLNYEILKSQTALNPKDQQVIEDFEELISDKTKIENEKNTQKESLIARKLEMKLEKANFSDESFALYVKYCKLIHNKDKEEKSGYKRFLCEQALEYNTIVNGDKILQLGCYHMNYYLDGKLVAVGVIDIFPECLSSVYFFYDPEYKYLSFGIWGSVKEIEYVQNLKKYFPNFKYYYLGYYVQTCQKMVYKGEYEPSELLCPITYTWVKVDDKLRKHIDENKDVRLNSKDISVINDMDISKDDIEKFIKDKVKLYINGFIKITQIKNQKYQQYFMKALSDITRSMGKKLSSTIVFQGN